MEMLLAAGVTTLFKRHKIPKSIFFLRNTVQMQTVTYSHVHSPYEAYPYEHLREAEPAVRS